MRLQQSPSLRPFPGEFVTFFKVTGRAREDKIVNIISWYSTSCDTCQREGVVNMINVFPPIIFPHSLKFVCAVVTAMPLADEQFLHLSQCVRSWYALFTCSSSVSVDAIHRFAMFCLIIPSHCFAYDLSPLFCTVISDVASDNAITVSLVILLRLNFCRFFLPISLQCRACNLLPTLCLVIAFVAFGDNLLMGVVIHLALLFAFLSIAMSRSIPYCSVIFSIVPVSHSSHRIMMLFMFLVIAFLTFRFRFFVSLVPNVVVLFEILFVCVVPCFLPGEPLFSDVRALIVSSGACVLTRLALFIQPVFFSLVAVEVISGGRIPLFTGSRTLFLWNGIGYNTFHERSSLLLSSHPRMVAHRWGKTLFTSSNYTTEMLIKPLQKPLEVCLW